MTGFLVIADGRRVAAENGLTIGRSPDCGLVLADTKASRHHARIHVEGGVAEIEDLGSSNGTLLNGKPVHRRVLRHGDSLQIGTTLLTFEEGVEGAGSPRPPSTPRSADRGAAEDDEVDLFAAEPDPASGAASGPEPRHEPPGRPVGPPPAVQAARPPEGVDEPPPPSPPPRPMEVLEFEDEVIEVRRAPRAPSEPTAGAPAESAVQHRPGALHYSRHTRESSGGGVMRDDLAQMPGWQRNLLVVLAVAAAAGIGYLAMVIARG